MEQPLTHRRRKEIASLAQKKYRERLGAFLVEGVRSVEAAVEAGAPLLEVLVSESAQEEARVQALLARTGAPVHVLPERDLVRLSDVQTSQGVLAVARLSTASLDTLKTKERLLILDGVQDPGNVGTILRTAAWFGADALLAGPGTADLFAPKVVRAAMGGLWDLPLARTDDLSSFLADLKASGFTLYGADLGGTPVQEWRPRRPSALLLGSEAHGLSPAAQARLDERIVLPGTPHRTGAESLNVAVAAGILLYAWLGQEG